MFFDFSSAFNTIQPALLNRKLLDMQVDAPLTHGLDPQLPHKAGRNFRFCSQSCHCYLQQKFSDDSAYCGLYQQGPGGGVQECGGQ
ncbi:hypothetical protein L3Q82_024074, partial [Scortum barcoo]